MNRLQLKYSSLFTIVIQQSFYMNNLHVAGAIDIVPDFDIVPTPECLAVAKRLNYVIKTGNPATGLTVLARVAGTNGGGDDLLRIKPMQTDKLSFYIMLRNHHAINFNKLPLQQHPGRLYYFSNEVVDGAAPRNNLHLSLAAAGVHEVNDATRENTDNYSITLPAAAATGSFIQHLVTGRKTGPAATISNGGSSTLSFKLAGLPPGKYKLVDGTPADRDLFYYNGSSLPSGAWGVIEIMLSPLIASKYQVIEPDFSLLPDRPAYTLLFENRLAKWRYTVKLPANSPLFKEIDTLPADADKITFLNHVNIVTNDGTITFALTMPVIVSPTPTQLEFVANTALRFKEQYFSTTLINKPLKLDLKKNIGLGPPPPIVKENLPHPGTALINSLTPPDIFSEIFITI